MYFKSVFLAFFTNIASISLLGCSAWLITRATSHPELAALSGAIVGVRFFGLSKAAFRYAERMSSHSVTLKKLTQIRAKILSSLAETHTSPLANSPSSEILGRFLKDVDTLGERFIRSSFPLFNAALGCVVVWTVLILWNFRVATATVLLHLIFGWALPFALATLRIKSSNLAQEIQRELRTRFGNAVLLRDDLSATGSPNNTLLEISALVHKHNELRTGASRLQSFQTMVSTLAPVITVALGLFLFRQPISLHAITPSSAAAFLFVCMAAFDLTNPVALAAETFFDSRMARFRVQSLLNSTPSQKSVTPDFNPEFAFAAQLNSISHRYPNAIENTLSNFSAIFPKTQTSLLLGHSGCGKSTLINIILGATKPNSGEVLLQSPLCAGARHRDHIFANTLRANLLLGNSQATESEVFAALKLVQLDEWVLLLPNGLDTFIGDGGNTISGGERQRLLIARALLKKSTLLCVDECTGHLPLQQETAILNNIRQSGWAESLLLAVHRDEPEQSNSNENKVFYLG